MLHRRSSRSQLPLVPDRNNNLPNHTYAVLKLGVGATKDAQVEYCQIPAWEDGDHSATKSQPSGQHAVLIRETVLDSKPTELYPSQ